MTRARFQQQTAVPVLDLLLDTANARIRHGADQGDCIDRILRKEVQLLALMRNIAEEGLSTAPILVSPSADGKWIVRDGNRRVTALKLLNNPSYAKELRVRDAIAAIVRRHADFPTVVDVLSCDDEQVIRREMLQRHSGELNGVGQVSWSTYLRTVFLLNGNASDPNKRGGQYAMWAEDNGIYVDDDFPVTTLQRITTRENLLLLGFKVENDKLENVISPHDAKRIATRVIDDLGSGRVKVDNVFTPAASKAYVVSVRAKVGIVAGEPREESKPEGRGDRQGGDAGDGRRAEVDPRETPPADGYAGDGESRAREKGGAPDNDPPVGDGGGDRSGQDGGAAGARGTARKHSWERKCLFPKGNPGFDLARENIKASTIIAELKRLDTKGTSLAVAVLLRCLVELSVSKYLETHAMTRKDALHKDVAAIARHMHEKGKLSQDQLDTMLRHAQTEAGLLSVKTLQKYVHSPEAHPNQQTLNTMWDEIGKFVGACWAPS